MTDLLGFDKPKLKLFKEAYEKALNDGAYDFVFEGRNVSTAYAKYTIEYLERQFK